MSDSATILVTDAHRNAAKKAALKIREAASRVSATKLTRGNVNTQYGRFKPTKPKTVRSK